jgi:hypothetical protein
MIRFRILVPLETECIKRETVPGADGGLARTKADEVERADYEIRSA